MKFELDFFEGFLQRELKGNRTSKTVVADFQARKEKTAQAVEKVKVNLRSQVFSQNSDSHLERYIQHHQTCIIGLADEVLTLLDEEDAREIKSICPKHSWRNLAKIFYKALDELLTYIEKYFSKFFNQQAKIPDCYAILSAIELEEKLNLFLATCEDAGADNEVVEIATTPLSKFIKEPVKSELSFSQLIYYKTLARELVNCTGSNSDDISSAITNQLIYLNFNTTQFLTYYTRRIIKQIEEDSSLPGHLEHLAYHRKLISQIQLKPGFAFRPQHPFDIQKQIIHWITEEINYVETKKHLKLIMLPAQERAEEETLKIATSLSVPQLAFFFRLLVDNNIIRVSNVSHLTKFLATHFTSLRNETLSIASLRNKYYDTDASTARIVKEILSKMSDRLKKSVP